MKAYQLEGREITTSHPGAFSAEVAGVQRVAFLTEEDECRIGGNRLQLTAAVDVRQGLNRLPTRLLPGHQAPAIRPALDHGRRPPEQEGARDVAERLGDVECVHARAVEDTDSRRGDQPKLPVVAEQKGPRARERGQLLHRVAVDPHQLRRRRVLFRIRRGEREANEMDPAAKQGRPLDLVARKGELGKGRRHGDEHHRHGGDELQDEEEGAQDAHHDGEGPLARLRSVAAEGVGGSVHRRRNLH
jgi:hypothetical protein